MAIVEVFEKLEGNVSKQDKSFQTSYTRVFQVVTSSRLDRARTVRLAVMSAAPVAIGDHYEVLDPSDGTTVLEQDTASFCTSISAAVAGSTDDGCQWDVTVEYSPSDGSPTFPPNPVEHPLKLSWGSQLVEVPVNYDRDGDPIQNSAGDFFDPTPTVMKYLILLNIVRNEATFSPTLAQTWKGTVNDATFTIAGEDFDPGTVKIADITSELSYNAECGWYWPVTYQMEIDPDGWKSKLLDQGMRTLVSGAKKAIADDSGKEVSTPELLDGSGVKLAVGADPVVLEFDVLPESDFSLLDFDFTDAPGYPPPGP